MSIFKMTSNQYFANISFQILPNNKKIDIFKIYTKNAVEKCSRWKPSNSKSKSGNRFVGHPVFHYIQYNIHSLDITKKEEVRRGKEACGKPNNDDDEEVECGIVKEIQKQ